MWCVDHAVLCRAVPTLLCAAGMSDFGITTWAQQPYSHDFAVGSNRPRKVSCFARAAAGVAPDRAHDELATCRRFQTAGAVPFEPDNAIPAASAT
jgi:hypothetical protein